MNYIEEHLTGEIDYEQLGRIAVKAVKATEMNYRIETKEDLYLGMLIEVYV
jgi:hypothetical protein